MIYKKYVYLLVLISMIDNACAASNLVVDVYRSRYLTAEYVSKKFGAQLSLMQQWIIKEQNKNKVSQAMQSIIAELKKDSRISEVFISPVYYPLEEKLFISIDVVDRDDNARYHTLLHPSERTLLAQQLLRRWFRYEKEGFHLLYQNKKVDFNHNCGAQHCLFGFQDGRLAADETYFSARVAQERHSLIKVLYHEVDAKKRSAAVFLLAYLPDKQVLFDILRPRVFDANPIVRNNVMRVMLAIIDDVEFDKKFVDDIILLLDFPVVSDRNKALMLLLRIAQKPKYLHMLVHAKKWLALAKTQHQPNISSPAKAILQILNTN